MRTTTLAVPEGTTRKPSRAKRGRTGGRSGSSEAVPISPLVQRSPVCACGGSCPRCVTAKATPSAGRPGDRHEREADRVAHQVMRGPGVQPILENVDHGSSSGGSVEGSPRLARSLATSRGRGHALDPATQSFMEERLGADLSHVSLHTGSEAAALSDDLQARAFSYGSDIYFNRGEYQPETTAGRSLLAHELTHVVQQRQAPVIQRFFSEKGSGSGTLPNGTVVLRGSTSSAQWLQGHRERGNPISEGITFVFVISSLSSSTTTAIATMCNQSAGTQAGLTCLHDQVQAAVRTLEASDGDPHDDDYVCRNYAASAHDVSQQMGLSPDWETSTTHAWLEFTDGNTQYVLDAYNGIMFSYPR